LLLQLRASQWLGRYLTLESLLQSSWGPFSSLALTGVLGACSKPNILRANALDVHGFGFFQTSHPLVQEILLVASSVVSPGLA
jgi:hypothetical protein